MDESKPSEVAPIDSDDAASFYNSLPAKNVEPLWLKFEAMVPPRPNPNATLTIWRYEEMKPMLLDAGRLVTIEDAERRVLMLVNPTMQAPCTTDTIYAGLQLIHPGETAPAHRHLAFALRFVIEGSGGFTAVEGQKIEMARGDVILTPSWTWHDHGNEGNEPVIWLDGLDLPLFKLLRLNFATPYPQSRYPSAISHESPLRFPWATVVKALKNTEGSYSRHMYRTEDGAHLSPTLSAQAERISTGKSSPISQETVSFVYHVVEGEGYSTIQSPGMQESRRIDWVAKDTFVVPAWSRISHTNTMGDGDAFLFAVNDRPMVEAMKLWRDGSVFSPGVA